MSFNGYLPRLPLSGGDCRSAGADVQRPDGYDLVGLTKQQVIDDVLERYETHLAFLTFSAETATASVLTPSVLPKDADDIQDIDEKKER